MKEKERQYDNTKSVRCIKWITKKCSSLHLVNHTQKNHKKNSIVSLDFELAPVFESLASKIRDYSHSVINENSASPDITTISSTIDQQFKLAAHKAKAFILEKLDSCMTKSHCPKCHSQIPIHSKRSRTIQTLHGKVNYRRGYYICKSCQVSFFPLDKELNIYEGEFQHDVRKTAIELATRTSFEESAELLKNLTQIELTPATIHGWVDGIGNEISFKDIIPTKVEIEEMLTSEELSEFLEDGKFRCIIAGDGCMEPMRPKGKKKKRRQRNSKKNKYKKKQIQEEKGTGKRQRESEFISVFLMVE